MVPTAFKPGHRSANSSQTSRAAATIGASPDASVAPGNFHLAPFLRTSKTWSLQEQITVTFALAGRCFLTLMRDRTLMMGDILNAGVGFLKLMTRLLENEFRSPVRT
jgi:hypothetical protein